MPQRQYVFFYWFILCKNLLLSPENSHKKPRLILDLQHAVFLVYKVRIKFDQWRTAKDFVDNEWMMNLWIVFCSMVDRRKVFSLISSRDHYERSSPSRISDTSRAGFEPAQNLSSGLVKWSCAVVITTTPRNYKFLYKFYINQGYHYFEIDDNYQKYLGFSRKIDGKISYFMFTVLPFSLSSIPFIFTKVMRCPAKFLEKERYKKFAYILTTVLDLPPLSPH